MNHQMEARKLIGLRIVEQAKQRGEITMDKIYEFAELIHPLRTSHPAMLRVLEPNQNCTDDYYENRLNVRVDKGIIVDVDWG